MTPIAPFTGFPAGCLRFLTELAAHNDREWFQAHKADHDALIVAPARSFIVALGERLRSLAPGVVADPRVNGSLFRQNRDTRFSHDKTPFKTHVGIWLWEGVRERMECTGFYVHIEPPQLMLAAGIHVFPRGHIDAFRASVADPRRGEALLKAVADVTAAGPYQVGGLQYKRDPPGYVVPEERRELLRFGGLYAGIQLPVDDVLDPDLPGICVSHFTALMPLHRWLVDLTTRVPG